MTITPFDEGSQAYLRGEGLNKNPHPRHTKDYDRWRLGWLAEQDWDEYSEQDADGLWDDEEDSEALWDDDPWHEDEFVVDDPGYQGPG